MGVPEPEKVGRQKRPVREAHLTILRIRTNPLHRGREPGKLFCFEGHTICRGLRHIRGTHIVAKCR
jgi:hypothetical protein